MTDTIEVGSLIVEAKPYIQAIVTALTPVIVGWGVMEVKKFFGFQIQQSAVDQIDSLAEAHAGALIASAADNLAHASVSVHSDIVAQAAQKIIDSVPGMIERSGLTPVDVQTMIAGKLGALQAQMTATVPPVQATKPPGA